MDVVAVIVVRIVDMLEGVMADIVMDTVGIVVDMAVGMLVTIVVGPVAAVVAEEAKDRERWTVEKRWRC